MRHRGKKSSCKRELNVLSGCSLLKIGSCGIITIKGIHFVHCTAKYTVENNLVSTC